MATGYTDEFKRRIEKDGVEYVRLIWNSLEGASIMKLVPVRHFKKSGHFGDGFSFLPLTNPGFRGPMCLFEKYPEYTCRRIVDPSTYALATWVSNKAVIADLFCHFRAKSFQFDSRELCKNILNNFQKKDGISPLSATEHEFILLKQGETLESTGELMWKDTLYANGLKLAELTDWFIDCERTLRSVGVEIETQHLEYAPSQIEWTVRPEYGLKGPDNCFRLRYITREMAQKAGWNARFATLPIPGFPVGSGAHLNLSLWQDSKKYQKSAWKKTSESDDSKTDDSSMLDDSGMLLLDEDEESRINLFWDESEEKQHFSEFGRQFIAGVFAHIGALCAFSNPLENDYSRIRTAAWAPGKANWGFDDRSALIRVKTSSDPSHTYIEFRLPGGAASPYLTLAALLVAGMDGVNQHMDCPPHCDSKAVLLPQHLSEALDCLEKDSLFQRSFSPEFCQIYLGYKRDQIKETEERIANGMAAEKAERLTILQI